MCEIELRGGEAGEGRGREGSCGREVSGGRDADRGCRTLIWIYIVLLRHSSTSKGLKIK